MPPYSKRKLRNQSLPHPQDVEESSEMDEVLSEEDIDETEVGIIADSADEEFPQESDSDDEQPKNRVGNIPMEWYKNFDHIGYGVDGQPLWKKDGQDKLKSILDRADNPDFWYVCIDIRALILALGALYMT